MRAGCIAAAVVISGTFVRASGISIPPKEEHADRSSRYKEKGKSRGPSPFMSENLVVRSQS